MSELERLEQENQALRDALREAAHYLQRHIGRDPEAERVLDVVLAAYPVEPKEGA